MGGVKVSDKLQERPRKTKKRRDGSQPDKMLRGREREPRYHECGAYSSYRSDYRDPVSRFEGVEMRGSQDSIMQRRLPRMIDTNIYPLPQLCQQASFD